MKINGVQVKLASVAAALIAFILVLMPFHAFLTVWLSSVFGHYTALRLWKEVLLLILAIKAAYLLYGDKSLRKRFIRSKLTWLIGAYCGVQVVWGLIAYQIHEVTLKALGFAWVINTRFLLFFLIVWLFAIKAPILAKKWPALVFWPAAVVVIFGLLQYFVLPYDVLKHVGYNDGTIYPYETINHDINYIRIMSTLRGANPLGAYAVLILSLLLVMWRKHKNIWYGLLSAGGLAILILSFSRSAWIGLILAVAVILWAMLKTKPAREYIVLGVLAIAVLMGSAAVILRHNSAFENAFFHTSDNSTAKQSSNQGHESALKTGLHDVAHQPLGRGPGTAGPASQYNNHPVRIAENYFVQVGQEVGWIGLALFAAINIYIGRELWLRRTDPLALGLLASLIGISFVGLLSHVWTDDTLAYMWWGLAGIALATAPKTTKQKKA